MANEKDSRINQESFFFCFNYCSFLLQIRSVVPNTLMERIETATKITAY